MFQKWILIERLRWKSVLYLFMEFSCQGANSPIHFEYITWEEDNIWQVIIKCDLNMILRGTRYGRTRLVTFCYRLRSTTHFMILAHSPLFHYFSHIVLFLSRPLKFPSPRSMNLEAESKDKHISFTARPMWIGSIFIKKKTYMEILARANQSVCIRRDQFIFFLSFFLFFYFFQFRQ